MSVPTHPPTRKRILYVTPFRFKVSGADESLYDILSRIDKTLFDPWVVHPFGSPFKSKFEAAGAHTVAFFLSRFQRSKNPFFWLMFLMWQPIEVFFFLVLIWRKKFDLIHVNMESILSPAVAAKLLGCPVIIHYRGKSSDRPKRFFDIYLKWISQLASQIVAISHASARGFFDRGLARNITVIHNATHLGRFHNAQAISSDAYPYLKNKTIILFVGRLDPQKRIDILLSAARSLCTTHSELAFVIVGGDLSNTVERNYHDLLHAQYKDIIGQNVWFLGHMSDVSNILAASTVLAMPAINEGFGRVVIEGMAARKVVVAAHSGAFPEILENGKYGILFEPDNSAALATAILAALQLSSDQTYLDRCLNYTQHHFSIQAYVLKLQAQYEKLI